MRQKQNSVDLVASAAGNFLNIEQAPLEKNCRFNSTVNEMNIWFISRGADTYRYLYYPFDGRLGQRTGQKIPAYLLTLA